MHATYNRLDEFFYTLNYTLYRQRLQLKVIFKQNTFTLFAFDVTNNLILKCYTYIVKFLLFARQKKRERERNNLKKCTESRTSYAFFIVYREVERQSGTHTKIHATMTFVTYICRSTSCVCGEASVQICKSILILIQTRTKFIIIFPF